MSVIILPRRQLANNRGQHFSYEIERYVHNSKIDKFAVASGFKVARVHTLMNRHPRVGLKSPIELISPTSNRDNAVAAPC